MPCHKKYGSGGMDELGGRPSPPAGEMPANACVHVREWRTLPHGTRRAHVCEVGSSPEKSGWLSCVAKDGRDTLLITTGKRVDNEVEA